LTLSNKEAVHAINKIARVGRMPPKGPGLLVT
jgi:hypothetical protein